MKEVFSIKRNVLEKRNWYQNPMTQAYNGKIARQAQMTEEEQVNTCINALLEAKGFLDERAKNEYLYPINGVMHDPFLFQDMALTCEIIEQAMLHKEKILIFGDFDCDGLTSTAIMVRGLRAIYENVCYFVPDRLEDGYGLTVKAIEQVMRQKPDLVISVDCGINSFEEVQFLMRQNIKVIVTDHHQPDESFAKNALTVINPQVEGESYPFQGLAGAGVALKVLEALYCHLGIEDLDLNYAKCLAALGTVADSMPLENENRVLVAFATSVFREKAPYGLRLMTDKITNNLHSSPIVEASFFGFSLGPRLNAAGRMGNLRPALTLLLSDRREELEQAIADLEDLNNQRKLLEQEMLNQAVEQIETMEPREREHILIVFDRSWHSGITGIVSSRLMEKFSLPVITFAGADNGESYIGVADCTVSEEADDSRLNGFAEKRELHGDEAGETDFSDSAGNSDTDDAEVELKGSARSMGNFDILSAISAAAEYTETFGGHLQAAGVTVKAKNFAAFKREVINYAAGNPLKKSELEDLQYQFELPHELVNDQLADKIMHFEPFGQKNEKPSFVIRNLQIVQWRAVGNGRHISLLLRLSDQRLISAIAFNASEFSSVFRQNDKVDLLVAINRKEWNSRINTQLEVLDWRVATLDSMIWDDAQRIEENFQIETGQVRKLSEMYGIDRKQFRLREQQIFHTDEYIQAHREQLAKGFNCTILARAIVREKRIFLNPFILQRILDIFKEINYLDWKRVDNDNIVLLSMADRIGDLSESPTWQKLQQQGLIVNDK